MKELNDLFAQVDERRKVCMIFISSAYPNAYLVPPPPGIDTFMTWPVNLGTKLQHPFTQVRARGRQESRPTSRHVPFVTC
jgi:hypothetical protein